MTTTPQRFTKRPVTIEAMQYDEHRPAPVIEWIRDNGGVAWLETRVAAAKRTARIAIKTLEGTMSAQPGDWIVRGVQGEFYPCPLDIFTQTYQPAAEHVEGEQAGHTDAEVEAVADVLEGLDGCDFATIARAVLVAARKAARHE